MNLGFLGIGYQKIETEPTIVRVSGVRLNVNTLELKVGDTHQLTETVLPADATNKAVTWKSNNTNATVVDGTTTANKAGSAIITVTTVDGGYTDTCSVTIQEQVVEEHTELESATLDGNCYFDTELLADINTNTEQKINVKSGSTYLFGARDNNYKFGFSVTDNFYAVRGVLSSGAKNTTYWEADWIVKQNKETFRFNDQQVQCDTIQELSMTSPMYIGNMSNNNAMAGNGMIGKFYYLKVYSGTTLISEIVPVRKSNRTLCLYDKIRKKYMYNKGSGILSV